LDRQIRLNMEILRRHEEGPTRGMNSEQENDRTCIKKSEYDLVTNSN
jgi:hypothetical protein